MNNNVNINDASASKVWIPSAEVLPEALMSMPNWLLWKFVSKEGQSKPAKVPYYVEGVPRSGALDSPADLARLTSFDDAVAAVSTGSWAGVGFAVTPDNGVGGIDLDNCLNVDREFTCDAARQIYQLAVNAGCYCEVTPSGKGVRIIGATKGFVSFNKGGFEAYCYKRFLTITGDCLANPKGYGSVDACIDLIAQLVASPTKSAGTQRVSKVLYQRPSRLTCMRPFAHSN